jgi:hypothetical protein
VLLENPVEVEGVPAASSKSARLGQIVLSDSVSSGTLGVSYSMHALPSVHSKATRPSSRTTVAPSLLSSSPSRARSGSYNLTATTDAATTSEGAEVLHQLARGD